MHVMYLIELCLIMGVVLLAQGLYAFRTGDLRMFSFLAKSPRIGADHVLARRLVGGLFFLLVGVWVLAVPFAARVGFRSLPDWAWSRRGELIGVGFCVGLGVLAIWRPSMLVRWVRSAYRGTSPETPSAIWVFRAVGIGGLAMGITLLARLLSR